jgi:opacity protein-like surface antigen
MRLSQLGVLCCVLSTAAPVFAQQAAPIPETNGFYATLGVGATWPQGVSVTDTLLNQTAGTTVNGTFNTGGGFAGDVGVGYDFGQIRTELTYAYTNSTLNSITATAFGLSGTAGVSGTANTNSVLLSAYWDIPTKSRWVPYIGGGLGYTNLGVSNITGSVLGYNYTLNGGNQGLFGYQAKAGVSYLTGPTTDVYVEGTYQGATGFSVGTTSYGSLNSWGAKVGFRYRFGQPKTAASN